MKKVLALLLVSAFVTAAAFAQAAPAAPAAPPAPSIKISGGVETGLYYQTNKIGDAGSIQLFDFDDTGTGTRAYIGALYDAGLYGFKATLRVDYIGTGGALVSGGGTSALTGGASILPYLSEGYAWVAPADGQLTFKVGAVTETALSTGGDQGFLSFNPYYFTAPFTGASLVIAPKNFPLTFGVLLPVDVNAIAGNADKILAGTTIAAKLTIPSVFDVVAGYTFGDSSLADTGISGSSTAYAPGYVSLSYAPFGLQALALGFDLLAVSGLTLNAEGYIPFDSGTQITFDEKLGVTVGNFYASVLAYEMAPNGTGAPDTYLTLKPYVGYTLDGGVTPGIYGFINTSNALTWSVDPNVKFALGSATFVIGASIGTNVARNRNANPTIAPDIGANLYTGFEFVF